MGKRLYVCIYSRKKRKEGRVHGERGGVDEMEEERRRLKVEGILFLDVNLIAY